MSNVLRQPRSAPSIRRYVMLEYAGIGLGVFERAVDEGDWIANALTAGDALRMSEIGIEVAVDGNCSPGLNS